MAGTSPHTAKETFLNYFFGGPNGTGPPNQSSSAPGSTQGDRRMQRPTPPGFSREKDLLPDLGSNRRHSARNSLDSPQAYDMKSLGKHLEAVGLAARCQRILANGQASGDQPLNLTPKEEMETTLIRSLIGSYFGITRQTIQDLVPKAIMHLLVSRACAYCVPN